MNVFGTGGGRGLFRFHTLLASGPLPAAAPPDTPNLEPKPPSADFATSRGFGVSDVKGVKGPEETA